MPSKILVLSKKTVLLKDKPLRLNWTNTLGEAISQESTQLLGCEFNLQDIQ